MIAKEIWGEIMEVTDESGVRFWKVVDTLRKHYHDCPNSPYYRNIENHWYCEGSWKVQAGLLGVTGWVMLEKLRALPETETI